MNKYFFFFLLMFIILLSGCKNDTTNNNAGKSIRMLPQDTLTRMVVAMEKLSLRAAPGTNQPMVAELKEGTELETTGAISPLKTSIFIRGVERQEPWIEVRNPKGVQGWIFGGGVKVEGAQNTPVASVLRKERLSSFFGPEKTRQILQYRADFYAVENPRDLENVFIRGTILRDSLVQTIGTKINVVDQNKLPDVSWLEDAMPGYTLDRIFQGSRYYLFQNYGTMKNWAKETEGIEDDGFFEFISFIYPEQAVEGFYPVWFEQTENDGGFSLLGEGKHLSVLNKMGKMLGEQPLFRNPVLKLKMKLLQDILNSSTGRYGATAEKIIEEIDAILSADLKILSIAEKNNLAERKKHFLDPTKFDLTLNLKSNVGQ